MTAAPIRFEAIGTKWQIDAEGGITPALLRDIYARIDEFDRAYSRFRDDSLVWKMAREGGTHHLPDDAKPMFDLMHDLYKRTDGLFTPLIGQTLSDAGYDKEYSLKPKALARPPRWDDALEYRFPELVLKRPALLDLGALGKGYLIDIVGEMLERGGIRSYTIDAGGDIRIKGRSAAPVRIGLEHPEDTSKAIGVATIGEGSICGSAGNRRVWGEGRAQYHHIMNPLTLRSPQEVVAVWTVAETTLLADALSTCLFFVSRSKLAEAHAFESLVMYKNHVVEKSTGFPTELFTK